MWVEIIAGFGPEYTFQSPATDESVTDTEKVLKVRFPDELKSLFSESNGVRGSYGLEVIWTVEEVKVRNLAQRQGLYPNYASFDTLLFFADAGNGDQFAYYLADGTTVGPSIWAWNHEDDEKRVFATSLRDFLELWLNGAKGV